MELMALDLRGPLFLFVCVFVIQLTATKVDAGLASVALNHREAFHQSGNRQQTSFSAEDPIQHPVNVPLDILQILRQDARNQTCLRKGQSKEDIQTSWFVASEIDLKSDRSPDLIVMAVNPCLSGANVVPFWVFRHTAGGHTLALSAPAFALDVLTTRSKTYRNLRLTALTAKTEHSTIYKFDGLRYKEWRRFQKPIRQMSALTRSEGSRTFWSHPQDRNLTLNQLNGRLS